MLLGRAYFKSDLRTSAPRSAAAGVMQRRPPVAVLCRRLLRTHREQLLHDLIVHPQTEGDAHSFRPVRAR